MREDSHTKWVIGAVSTAIISALIFFALADRESLRQTDVEQKALLQRNEMIAQQHTTQLAVLGAQFSEFKQTQLTNMEKLERRLESIEAGQRELLRRTRARAVPQD